MVRSIASSRARLVISQLPGRYHALRLALSFVGDMKLFVYISEETLPDVLLRGGAVYHICAMIHLAGSGGPCPRPCGCW